MQTVSIPQRLQFLKDPRDIQILYLAFFLITGIFWLKWEVSLTKILLIIGSCVFTQMLWLFAVRASIRNIKSAIITGLGLCLILHSNSLYTLSMASIVAISSKFIIRYNNKHLFNPGNFGIVIAILFFKDAWISPGQWGSDGMFVLVLCLLGGLILFKIGRLETSLVFLGCLFCLEYLRTVLYQGWEIDVLIHKFSSGTLLLFTFFMITDPMTIPNNRMARVFWSILLALLTFIAGNWLQLYTAPIWMLFLMTPVTILLDKIKPSQKFKWLNSNL